MTIETQVTTTSPAPADGYQMRKPIELGGESVAKLEFQDCPVAIWLQLDKFTGTERDQHALIYISSANCDVAGAVVPAMSVRDFRGATKAMWEFLGSRALPPVEDQTTTAHVLAAPVQTDKGPLVSLELREPTARDLIVIDPLSGVAKDVAAVAACTGLDRAEVLKLGVRDFLAAAGWVADFFDDAPATGA